MMLKCEFWKEKKVPFDDDYTGRGVFFWTLTFHDKFHWSNRAISSSKSQKIQLPRSPLFTSDVIKVEAITWSWL